MKIRNGFVSNSSSSSFLILITPENKHLIHYNHNLIEQDFIFDKDAYELVYDSQKCEYVEVKSIDRLKNKGYKFVKEEMNCFIYERTIKIKKATTNTRSTCMAFGNKLKKYINEVNSSEYKQESFNDIIQQYKIDNLLYLRESDEGSGGSLTPELKELTKDALVTFEYH